MLPSSDVFDVYFGAHEADSGGVACGGGEGEGGGVRR